MQVPDTSVFSKVMGKVSNEFLNRLFSKNEIYQAFLGLIRSKPGVELIYDQRKNTCYIGGSWDAICLIRQQMIVLIDCVFTFNSIQPCSQASIDQHHVPPQHIHDGFLAPKLQCSDVQVSQQFSTIPCNSLFDPSKPLFQIICKGDRMPLLHDTLGDSPQLEDINASLIEKLDNLGNTNNPNFSESYGFTTTSLSNSLTFDSGDEGDQGHVNSVLDIDANPTMTSAILDLSRKVDAVSVNETFVLNDNSVGNCEGNLQGGNTCYTERCLPSQTVDAKLTNSLETSRKKNSGDRTTNTCVICSKTFLNKSNMVRHAKSIHKITNVKNPMTFEVKESPDDQAMEALHESSRWNCRQSKDSIENRSCKFCLKVFSTRSNLYKHSRKCKQAHECNECHQKFESHDLLCHHVFVVHALFLCRMCDKMVDSEENYADHVNFCHPNYSLDDVITTNPSEIEGNDSASESSRGRTGVRNQPFVRSGSCMGAVGMGGSGRQPIRCHRPNPCLKCGKVFSTFSNLLKHIRIIHENARFPCNLCKRVFACKDGLKHHMDKVHNKVTYKCDLCSMVFENQLRLAKHLSLIHDQQSTMYNFQCELCGKTFLYKTNLKRHKKLEHEGLRYSCQRCNMSFRSKNQLDEHHRIVHLGLLLKCDTCDKQFHTWTTLRDHERAIHGKHAPIVCVICGKKFTRYPGLSYHLRKHHKRKYNVAGEVSANHKLEFRKTGKKMKNAAKPRTASDNGIHARLLKKDLDAVPSSIIAQQPSTKDDEANMKVQSQSNYNMSNISYVPSFYDQQFQLQDVLSVQKSYDVSLDVHIPHKITQFLGFESDQDAGSSKYESGFPTSGSSKYESGFPTSGFGCDMQEAAILCLSDTINFYDNLTLSPAVHQPPSETSNAFSEEFMSFNLQS